MTFWIQCSNCGHKSRAFNYERFPMTDPAVEIVKAGWSSYGDVFYCPKCSRTWEERNGSDKSPAVGYHVKIRVYQEMVKDLISTVSYYKQEAADDDEDI